MGRGGTSGRALALIELKPGGPAEEGFLGPDTKRLWVNDGGLNDLPVPEHAPGDRSRRQVAVVGVVLAFLSAERTFLIQGLVGQGGLSLELLDELCEPAGRNEKLQVGFLIDIALSRAPAEGGVVALDTVDCGLRVDGEAAAGVDGHKVVRDAA